MVRAGRNDVTYYPGTQDALVRRLAGDPRPALDTPRPLLPPLACDVAPMGGLTAGTVFGGPSASGLTGWPGPPRAPGEIRCVRAWDGARAVRRSWGRRRAWRRRTVRRTCTRRNRSWPVRPTADPRFHSARNGHAFPTPRLLPPRRPISAGRRPMFTWTCSRAAASDAIDAADMNRQDRATEPCFRAASRLCSSAALRLSVRTTEKRRASPRNGWRPRARQVPRPARHPRRPQTCPPSRR